MAIALRGTAKSGNSTSGGAVTLTFDGSPNNPQEGDVVIVWGGHPYNSGDSVGPSTGGYTAFAVHTATNPMFGMWYKFMGSSPDTNVVNYGTGISTNGVAYGCVVLSGVDPVNIIDTDTAVAGPTTGTNPDPPSVVTVRTNAMVIIGAGNNVSDASRGTVTNYTLMGGANANASGVDFSEEGGRRTIATPGTENPPAWSSWASGDNYRITVALRPGVAMNAVSTAYTLTGSDATVGRAISFNAEPGSLSITGTTGGVLADRVLAGGAETNAFSLTGADLTFLRDLLLSADSGTLGLTGVDATLTKELVTALDAGNYELAGSMAAFLLDYVMTLSPETLQLTGADLTLLRGLALIAEVGGYSVSGQDLSFLYDRVLGTEPVALALTGANASFVYETGGGGAPPGSSVGSNILVVANELGRWI